MSGHAPDSVYAEWTADERAASDRMEGDFNATRRAILASADLMRRSDPVKQPKDTGPLYISGPTVRGHSDDMLQRAAKRMRRQLEDIAEGDHTLPAKGPRGVKARVRFLNVVLRDIEREQEFRAALAYSWLAAEDGTHCYTAYQARGGLDAVLNHGAPPASYDLAVTLDWELWRRGGLHVLAWKDES